MSLTWRTLLVETLLLPEITREQMIHLESIEEAMKRKIMGEMAARNRIVLVGRSWAGHKPKAECQG